MILLDDTCKILKHKIFDLVVQYQMDFEIIPLFYPKITEKYFAEEYLHVFTVHLQTKVSIQPSSLHSVLQLLMHASLENTVTHCYTINDTSVVELIVPVIGSITELIPVCTQIWICFKYKSSLNILVFFTEEVPDKRWPGREPSSELCIASSTGHFQGE